MATWIDAPHDLVASDRAVSAMQKTVEREREVESLTHEMRETFTSFRLQLHLMH